LSSQAGAAELRGRCPLSPSGTGGHVIKDTAASTAPKIRPRAKGRCGYLDHINDALRPPCGGSGSKDPLSNHADQHDSKAGDGQVQFRLEAR
jgi:hypothetical protein